MMRLGMGSPRAERAGLGARAPGELGTARPTGFHRWPAVVRLMATALRADDVTEQYLLVPADSKKQLPWNRSCPIWGVGTLAEAMARLWPGLDPNAMAWNC